MLILLLPFEEGLVIAELLVASYVKAILEWIVRGVVFAPSTEVI